MDSHTSLSPPASAAEPSESSKLDNESTLTITTALDTLDEMTGPILEPLALKYPELFVRLFGYIKLDRREVKLHSALGGLARWLRAAGYDAHFWPRHRRS